MSQRKFDLHKFLSRLVSRKLRDKSVSDTSIPTAEILKQELAKSYEIVDIQQTEVHASLISLGISPSFLELAKQGFKGFSQFFRDWADSRLDRPLTIRQTSPKIVDALITLQTQQKWSVSPWTGAVLPTRDSLGPNWYLFREGTRGFISGHMSTPPFLSHDNVWIIPGIEKILFVYAGVQQQHLLDACSNLIVRLAKEFRNLTTYLESKTRKLVVCDWRCEHFGHYVWNVISAWGAFFEQFQGDQVETIVCWNPDKFFGGITAIFDVHGRSVKEKQVSNVDEVYDLLFSEYCLFSSIDGEYITEFTAARVVSHCLSRCEPVFRERLLSARRQHWPIVLLSLRLGNRSWVDQIEGFRELAIRLGEDFPDIGFVIHGLSKGVFMGSTTSWMSLEADIQAAAELERALEGRCIANAVGLSIHESVAISDLCDSFVAPIGSGMALYKWLTNKPGVGFSNRFCSDPANSERWAFIVFDQFRTNVVPACYLPLSAIEDVDPACEARSRANFTLDRSVLYATVRNHLVSLLNLALRKPALQSSISAYSVGRTAAEDAQGGNNGSTCVDYGFHTANERDPWWQVDLEDLFQVQQVVIFNRLNQAERLRHFTLLGSRDGVEWTILFCKTDDRVLGQQGGPFVAEIADGSIVRFVRVQLDGHAPLHFRECQVFGVPTDPDIRARVDRVRAQVEKRRTYVPRERRGSIVQIAQLAIFVDENYERAIVESLKRGDYKATEGKFIGQFVTHRDRIIALDASFGLLSMTAARIAGAESVLTVHSDIAAANDARDNFKRNGFEVMRSRVGILRNRYTINAPASRMNVVDAEPAIAKEGQPSVLCLEDLIDEQQATVLVCDLEGEEIDVLNQADLAPLRLILLKTSYSSSDEPAVDELVGKLIASGFSLHLGCSHDGVLVMTRHARAV